MMPKQHGNSKYTKKLANEICKRMAKGESVNAICKTINVDESTVRQWNTDNIDGFSPKYVGAREAQGEHYAFKVLETCEKVADESLKPDQGRVINDGLKWMAGKLNSKYSEKTRLTGADDETPVKVDAITRTIINPENTK